MISSKKNVESPPLFFLEPHKKIFDRQKIKYKFGPPQIFFLTSSKKNWDQIKRREKNCIGATIRVGWDIQCLPYAGFFLDKADKVQETFWLIVLTRFYWYTQQMMYKIKISFLYFEVSLILRHFHCDKVKLSEDSVVLELIFGITGTGFRCPCVRCPIFQAGRQSGLGPLLTENTLYTAVLYVHSLGTVQYSTVQ